LLPVAAEVVVGQAERAVARLAVLLLLAVALVAELDPVRRAVPALPE
jgi:hypothetical protein